MIKWEGVGGISPPEKVGCAHETGGAYGDINDDENKIVDIKIYLMSSYDGKIKMESVGHHHHYHMHNKMKINILVGHQPSPPPLSHAK